MANEPIPPQPPPTKPPSGLWKWTKRIGCTFLLGVLGIVLTCCGITCGGFWWIASDARAMNKDDVDRVLAEALRDGDVKAMHEHADPAFRAKISREELQAFLDARPGLLDRANLVGVTLVRRKFNNNEFVKLTSARNYWFGDRWEIVCRVVNDVLVFVGISPGLDEFVPSGFKHRVHLGRRHRWWD